jgi:hypothetical protein
MLTPISITEAIIQGLQGWRDGTEIVFNIRTTAGQLGIAQSGLGWKHFFEGRVHKQWRQHMTRYYKEAGERRTGKRWTSALIRKMWDIAWDLWEHRNGILHDKHHGYKNLTLVNKIKELWHHPSVHRIASIKHLISGTTEEVQGQSLHQK